MKTEGSRFEVLNKKDDHEEGNQNILKASNSKVALSDITNLKQKNQNHVRSKVKTTEEKSKNQIESKEQMIVKHKNILSKNTAAVEDKIWEHHKQEGKHQSKRDVSKKKGKLSEMPQEGMGMKAMVANRSRKGGVFQY
ncbi:hypothetical protein ACOSQ4_004963 [Xanthoceras sorbifolium]